VDWPEQEVKVVEEDIARSARVTYQMVEGGVKQMTVTIPRVLPGEEVRALVTLEIRRSKILPPENTDRYVLPDTKKLDRKVRPYLGPSPYIESRNPKIVALSKEISGNEKNAWAKAESFYKWIHAHIKYQNGAIKGAMAALTDKTGDCEEMTCLFIAFCRASNIPARTVHVPDHCYPEFYLCDETGAGHWFPCEATNSPAFGGTEETRPVLEKGDNFRDPRNPKERHHYLPETLTGSGGRPQVKFVRDLLPAN
jgi:transglutaminase-like putative cysteine protease